MKLVIISDTHGLLLDPNLIPEADVLIHCGDICPNTDHSPIFQYWWLKDNFYPWLKTLKTKYKLLIPGNHDWFFEKKPDLIPNFETDNIFYMHERSKEINGIKFWGTAFQKEYCRWSFNKTEEELYHIYNNIPLDTNVLITHNPPYGILDVTTKKRTGSTALLNRLQQLKDLKLNCFGHIHENESMIEISDIKFVNAALTDDKYKLIKKPIIVEI